MAHGPRPSLVALVVLALLAHSVLSYRAFLKVVPRFTSPQACVYLGRLQASLGRLPKSPRPTFVDSYFPLYLDATDVTFRRTSELFEVLGASADFRRDGALRVTDAGNVVRVSKKRRRSAGTGPW